MCFLRTECFLVCVDLRPVLWDFCLRCIEVPVCPMYWLLLAPAIIDAGGLLGLDASGGLQSLHSIRQHSFVFVHPAPTRHLGSSKSHSLLIQGSSFLIPLRSGLSPLSTTFVKPLSGPLILQILCVISDFSWAPVVAGTINTFLMLSFRNQLDADFPCLVILCCKICCLFLYNGLSPF